MADVTAALARIDAAIAELEAARSDVDGIEGLVGAPRNAHNGPLPATIEAVKALRGKVAAAAAPVA